MGVPPVVRISFTSTRFEQTRDDREAFGADLYNGLQQLADAGEIELVTSTEQDPDHTRNDRGGSDLDEGHNRRYRTVIVPIGVPS